MHIENKQHTITYVGLKRTMPMLPQADLPAIGVCEEKRLALTGRFVP
jgi:hypothetical protein